MEAAEMSDHHKNFGNPLMKKRKESEKKANLFSQITITEAAIPQRFNLCRLQLKKHLTLAPHQFCKGKSIVEPSNNTTEHMDIVEQTMGIHFQEEIVMEILIRLPVQSLLRFKCVSKLWKALISDPFFKKKHLNHAKSDEKFQKLFVARMLPSGDDECTFYRLSLSRVQLVEDEQKLDFPWNLKPECCITLCCCDGLVLLALAQFCDGRTNEHLLLWNPSTRESIELPRPKSPLMYCVFGMGYDTTSDDYKILAIDLNRRSLEVSCEILALKSGFWKVCNYPTDVWRVWGYLDNGTDALAFLHGAFHWVGRTRHYTILSFNISNEEYGEIPTLDQMFFKPNAYIEHGVSILRGMLCFHSAYKSEVEGTFKLWVMKDYGVKESWTQLFTIGAANLFSSARPKYRYADGEVLLCFRRSGRVGSVYRTSKGPFGLWPSDISATKEAVYTESLISPKLLV